MSINAYVTQSSPPWGLARISHRSGTASYVYDNTAGAGTCAYIVDTGIYVAHPVRIQETISREKKVPVAPLCY
jgi:hypothetical protein